MNALTTLDFEEKPVRVVEIDGAPWFVGKDVCAALEIGDHHQALERLDPDEIGRYNLPTYSRGNPDTKIISEPGCYRLIFTSRTEPAERFKRWLAHDVLPALRKTGAYFLEAIEGPRKGWPTAVEESAMAAMLNAIAKIRGPEAANDYYDRSPFPKLRGRAAPSELIEAQPAPGIASEPLRLLLEARLLGGKTVCQTVHDARHGDERAHARLLAAGILAAVPNKHRGFVAIAGSSEIAEEVFERTRWRKGWMAALAKLSGAKRPTEPLNFGTVPRRCVLLPITLFEECAQ